MIITNINRMLMLLLNAFIATASDSVDINYNESSLFQNNSKYSRDNSLVVRGNFLFCNGAEYNEQINIQEVRDISNNISIDHIKTDLKTLSLMAH